MGQVLEFIVWPILRRVGTAVTAWLAAHHVSSGEIETLEAGGLVLSGLALDLANHWLGKRQ